MGKELKQDDVIIIRKLISEGDLISSEQSGCYIPTNGLGIHKQ